MTDMTSLEPNAPTRAVPRGQCPRCRAPIPAQLEGEGLCPACWLSQAAAPDAAADDATLGWPEQAPAPAPLPARSPDGSLHLGDYRLLRELGRGGMGQVFEAEHRPSGRRVALKRLGRRLLDPEMRQRFLREGRLAASVSHANSLYVFGSESIDDAPVITMEVADGGTLQDELDRRGPLPVKRAVDAMLDVVRGLEAAHAVGVLHRDVKPSNCFVGPEGSVKVGDYGLSVSTRGRDGEATRAPSFATTPSLVLGTPAFASPEQLRGDDLDLRADIYSTGATLFTLLTGRAPFHGENAVQVVANALNRKPPAVSEFRDDIPAGLEDAVARCLAKTPDGRFADYAALRRALRPFSSAGSEPAPPKVRAAAGWMDFLLAFFVPYLVMMVSIGSAAFHFTGLFERSLHGFRFHVLFLLPGLLYFAIAEGFFGAGVGKRRKGLKVEALDGSRPGFLRALARIALPIATIEAVRLPLLFATIPVRDVISLSLREILIYTVATTVCPWLVAALPVPARFARGGATLWDVLSGTRVVFRPVDVERPAVGAPVSVASGGSHPARLGPFTVDGAVDDGRWLTATDPVLRRPVWLLRRGDGTSGQAGEARRRLGRPGRPRWLQAVEVDGETWDAFEARPGAPLRRRLGADRPIPWRHLRHWLHDLASELWSADGDGSLPERLGLDHVWLTTDGRALLLDRAWPSDAPAPPVSVQDFAGQQRFLASIADLTAGPAPLHAGPVLDNLRHGRFEKLSFLTGTLQGLLERPAELGRTLRAGSLLMLPVYTYLMSLLGSQDSRPEVEALAGPAFGPLPTFILVVILATCAATHLLMVPFRTTPSHALFRLAVVDAAGRLASRKRLLGRWAPVWLPLIGVFLVAGGFQGPAMPIALTLWSLGVVASIVSPHRGPHDRLAGTWVVRR